VSTTIRLTRMGRKKHPFYRLIVTDSRNRRDGAYLANLGHYDPFADPYEVKLHEDEILTWLSKGATMSDTARSLIQREGILYRRDLERKGLDASEVAAKVAVWRDDFANRENAKAKAKADAERIAKKEEADAKKAAEDEERKVAEAAAAAEAAEAAAAEAAEAEEAAATETPEAEETTETTEAAEAADDAAEDKADEVKDEG